jgi:hypothetical protein
MALAEGAAARILADRRTGKPSSSSVPKASASAGGPVDALAGLDHLAAALEQRADGLVDVEAFGDG